MNALLRLDGIELWHSAGWIIAGWTMLHFLWLGSLVGLVALACRVVLRRASANVRYVAALLCLGIIAALPVAISGWLMADRQAATRVWRVVDMSAVGVPIHQRVVDLPPSPVPAGHPASESAGGIVDLARTSSPMNTAPTIEPVPIAVPNTGANPRQSRGLADVIAGVAEYLPWLWLIGTPLTFLLLTTGVVGAERLRRGSRSITEGPIAEAAARIAASLRLGRRVTVAICERIAAPVLVGIVRPMILLPPAALTGWSPEEIEMVLLHELAHVRRWDNLVNLAQRIIESLLFFHPAVWLVSNWARREREACCDAVVVTRTNRPHAYAELLVALASQLPRSVLFHPAASSAMAAGPLRGRIRHILGVEDDPLLISGKSLAVVMSGLLVAATLVVLNLTTSTQAEEELFTTEGTEGTEKKSDRRASRPSMGFTIFHGVPFEVGASRFADGDAIAITGIKGTSRMFEPGNVYQIHGTYTLASRDRASLAAFVTARSAEEGISQTSANQSMAIERGSGTFMLEMPMKVRGWPHVSFYPAEGGASFGGVYFGTGDSVLENWWEVYGSDDTRSAGSHAKVDRGKFPSLEDQKLADLAWKRLGLELEPIGQEDLKRVHAFGYDGGLRVTGQTDRAIGPGNILVGLHVWPMMSLRDVANVLNRDDLSELSPLKYYIVAQQPVNEQVGEDEVRTVMKDAIETGRISVRVDESSSSLPRPTLQPKASQTTIPRAYEPIPVIPLSESERTALLQRGPIQIHFFYAPNSEPCRRAEEMVAEYRKAFPEMIDVKLFNVEEQPALATQESINVVPTLKLLQGGNFIDQISGAWTVPQLEHRITEYARRRPPQAKEQPQPELRYDGKKFDVWWKQWWQHPDGSQQRLDALTAFGAFAEAGYGVRATEMILEASFADYDYTAKDARGYLRKLSPADSSTIVSKLVGELERDLSLKRRLAATRALAAIGPPAKPALDVLAKSLSSRNHNERIVAATAIKMIVGKDQYQKYLADVMGEELGITAVKTESGAWGVVPREDTAVDADAFNNFNNEVIEVQEDLFLSDEEKPKDSSSPRSGGGVF